MEIPMSLRLDDDGLLRKECPYCEQQFKIYPSDERDEEQKLYCPICGIPAPENFFYTKEQLKKAETIAANVLIDELNKSFRNLQRSTRNNQFVQIDFKPMDKKEVKTLVEVADFDDVIMTCCNKHTFIFAPSTYKVLYCHHCGEMNFPR